MRKFSNALMLPPDDPTLPRGALVVEELGRLYRSYPTPAHWLLERLHLYPPPPETWVLRHLNFTLAPGDALGIIGVNGAGKSTLLQIIAGTLPPTTGRVRKNGRIAALLELGAGFNPEFTGRENARLNALLLGLTPAEIDAHLPAILQFADLGDAIDRPVRTYSSGMFVRLAFAVATAIAPDILIIDEALAVGDGAFAQKSLNRILQLRAQGTTLLFVSHALYQIERLCPRALWLHGGQIQQIGDSATVVAAYRDWLDAQTRSRPSSSPPTAPPSPAPHDPHPRLLAASAAWCAAAVPPTPLGHPLPPPPPDDRALRLELTLHLPDPTLPPCTAFALKTPHDFLIASGRSHAHLTHSAAPLCRHTYTLDLSLLAPGHYRLDLYTLDPTATLFWEHHREAWTLTIPPDPALPPTPGLIQLPYTWTSADPSSSAGSPLPPLNPPSPRPSS
ncbi:MAG: polysaccharide ABC transporter ATP-binding protein [Hydrogenophilus sp.]|nr:polysaccharide ABC transporter ATP-binding protein [Hydrogenophilus sp.]